MILSQRREARQGVFKVNRTDPVGPHFYPYSVFFIAIFAPLQESLFIMYLYTSPNSRNFNLGLNTRGVQVELIHARLEFDSLSLLAVSGLICQNRFILPFDQIAAPKIFIIFKLIPEPVI
jgi:hypothetical protein